MRLLTLSGMVLLGGALSGCASATAVFDQGFLNSLGLGFRSASLPGDAPALLVAVENRLGKPINVVVSYRDNESAVQNYFVNVQPSDKTARSLVCSISELTVGNVTNLDEPGASVTLGEGGANDPFIEVEPFGILLREGSNYECGDAVTFTVLASGDTLSGYRVYAFVERAQ